MHICGVIINHLCRFITVLPPLEVIPGLFISMPFFTMDPLKHLSNMIFQSGQIAPRSCIHCATNNYLCVVSAFSNSCGLCLRSARCCSFMLSSVPAWAVADSEPSIDVLRSDLRRTAAVLSQLSLAFDASGSASGSRCVRIFESPLDNAGL